MSVSSYQPLAGKVAWVTGSSRGLGRVIATHLGTLGASLVVHGPRPPRRGRSARATRWPASSRPSPRRRGAQVQMVHGDLTDPGAVDRIVSEINARFGQIDILVANAGGDIGAGGTMAAGAASRTQTTQCSSRSRTCGPSSTAT